MQLEEFKEWKENGFPEEMCQLRSLSVGAGGLPLWLTVLPGTYFHVTFKMKYGENRPRRPYLSNR